MSDYPRLRSTGHYVNYTTSTTGCAPDGLEVATDALPPKFYVVDLMLEAHQLSDGVLYKEQALEHVDD